MLITGATGFLGTWVTDALARSGLSVRALARRNSRTTALERLNVDIVHGDVTTPETLASAMADCDAVVHCAGIVSLNPRDRHDMQMVNVEGTRAVCRLRRCGAQRSFTRRPSPRSDPLASRRPSLRTLPLARYLSTIRMRLRRGRARTSLSNTHDGDFTSWWSTRAFCSGLET